MKNRLFSSTWHGCLTLFCATGVALLSGCAGLPRSGPTTNAIISGSRHSSHGQPPLYRLVDLTSTVARSADQKALAGENAKIFRQIDRLPQVRPAGMIGQDDLLKITLWEPNPTGTTLLNQPGLNVTVAVAANGTISVPYVGTIYVAGHSPSWVVADIQSILAKQGHDIQASVLDINGLSSSVIVQGQVGRPGEHHLTQEGRNLLDVLAIAGGSTLPNHSAEIRITRNGIAARMPLAMAVRNSRFNIDLSPADQILVTPRRRFYYALGAVNAPGQHIYNASRITLTQALAQVAGLNDNLAAPRGVFIYRRSGLASTMSDSSSQVIYRLNMTKPDSFFIADQFTILPGDVLYVSDAPVANLTKVLQTISGISNIAAAPRNFGAPY